MASTEDAVAVAVLYVVAYAAWQYVDVRLVPRWEARTALDIARMAEPGQSDRDLTDRLASSTTLRQGDDADRRSSRSIRSTTLSVVDRLRRRGGNQRGQPRTGAP